MLANQFAVDLRQEIKAKVAGVEGAFEKLLSNAKCEEAKLRDITLLESAIQESWQAFQGAIIAHQMIEVFSPVLTIRSVVQL